ncbi:hypothetical protein PLICRDRAFT_148664 [Plicaturopsis crispa FD-325 SS-3]|nr:hypothetical protein PLICRDRAFT_148664 [Plicaturopsis crispa FD-325 SS-3]
MSKRPEKSTPGQQSSRPASSASQARPGSAASRPPSSLSHRPPSSLSHRPPSSVSHRPVSSASTRPPSSASTRPPTRTGTASRLSRRPPSRTASRLVPFAQALVTNTTGITAESDPENFVTATDYVVKNVEFAQKGATGSDMSGMDKVFAGHVQKARINSQDEIADALQTAYKLLKAQFAPDKGEQDLDSEIKMSRLPDHLQLLLLLSSPSTQATTTHATKYLDMLANPPQTAPTLTWAEILKDDPFEGEHWEGVWSAQKGWEAGSTSDGSTPSLSPLEDDDDDDDDEYDDYDSPPMGPIDPPSGTREHKPSRPGKAMSEDAWNHRREFEALRARQYWREEWRTDASLTLPFDLGDASTLGPALWRALGERQPLSLAPLEQDRYINEHDAVREVLMALQGRANILLVCSKDHVFTPARNAPRLVHFTLTSQASLLNSFAENASIFAKLRQFVASVFSPPSSQVRSRTYRTLEAFADALNTELQTLDAWCASQEDAICAAQAGAGPPLPCSLLSLEKRLQTAFAQAFPVLLSILPAALAPRTPQTSPAQLLDSLLDAVHAHLSMDDHTTADALTRVFATTAEPLWAMLGRWLRDGMPIRTAMVATGTAGSSTLDEEFFIEDNELVLVDPDFWSDGYVLREAGAPVFLDHVAQLVLGAGKAVGLLRVLGADDVPNVQTWMPFADVLALEGTNHSGQLISVSADTLARLVYEKLQPRCEAAGESLTRVLVDDCALWRHLGAIEDLYLMRRGEAMSHFADVLFAKMDAQQSWGDFHFLNSAFGDVVEAGAARWVETSLVRLSYRGGKDRERMISRTVKALDGLLVEYAVPFPLTYVFGPRALQAYGKICVMLLQVRRAKSVLERILVRGAGAAGRGTSDGMKVFYAMRSKLSWFINSLLNFLTTHVIHTQIQVFHEELHKAKSLDEVIRLHDEYVEKIQGRCLLLPNTSALHRAILSILDMALHFSDYFIASAGDTHTHDISRQSVSMRHRSKRQRRQRRNVIGFSQSMQESMNSSDDDDSDDEADGGHVPEPSSLSVGMSTDEGLSSRLDKMSVELDGLVRFVRRGVESLSGGTGEAAPAFGIFAFALEDWDR